MPCYKNFGDKVEIGKIKTPYGFSAVLLNLIKMTNFSSLAVFLQSKSWALRYLLFAPDNVSIKILIKIWQENLFSKMHLNWKNMSVFLTIQCPTVTPLEESNTNDQLLQLQMMCVFWVLLYWTGWLRDSEEPEAATGGLL